MRLYTWLNAVLILFFLSGHALSQQEESASSGEMDHSQMDHSKMDHSKMNDAEMDHSQMDHSQMDHSKMNDTEMDHSQMDHSQMDHSKMNDTEMDHSQMDHSQMDHSKMNDAEMDHSQMDHSQMDHSQMGHEGHGDHAMTFDEQGMVMNFNTEKLPGGCDEVSEDVAFTVRAGTAYAEKFAGDVFGMDTHELAVKPCSRVTVTFINEDAVRHQFMVHGLPKYIYSMGMFHIEAAGGATKQGTFIVPGENKTYLLHCDLAQHMENGMKAQLVVGKGSGDLTSVPGISAKFRADQYLSKENQAWAIFGGLVLAILLLTPLIRRWT